MLCLLISLFLSFLSTPANATNSSAVVFMYHRFGDDRYPTTNIKIAQFKKHLAEIATGHYNVMRLRDIIVAFRLGKALPDRTIALTIDDAFLSIHQQAWPLLAKAGLPFTLFVATDAIDAKRPTMMSWSQLKTFKEAGVTIANHTSGHTHLPDLTQKQLDSELANANKRFEEELGFVPDLLAYPYGEFGQREQEAAKKAGFIAAFGQHSGVAHNRENLYGLPRFALNEKFGTIKRFRMAANALSLPVSDILPIDNILRANNPPVFGFTVAKDLKGLQSLACFASNASKPAKLERLGSQRFEVRLDKAFNAGRGRINCTLKAEGNRWRWFGTQFYIPKPKN